MYGHSRIHYSDNCIVLYHRRISPSIQIGCNHSLICRRYMCITIVTITIQMTNREWILIYCCVKSQVPNSNHFYLSLFPIRKFKFDFEHNDITYYFHIYLHRIHLGICKFLHQCSMMSHYGCNHSLKKRSYNSNGMPKRGSF